MNRHLVARHLVSRHLIALVFSACVLCASPRAEAKWFEFWGSAIAGYGWGTGTTDKDFYKHVNGAAAGLEVGAKILFIGAFVDYLVWPQDFSTDRLAHLLTFNLGGDWDLSLTEHLSLIIRVAGGFYLGFMPEESVVVINGVSYLQQSTRGVGAHGGLGVRYSFARVLSIGITPEVGYHYFFGGPGTPVNTGNSHGFDINILAYFRLGLGV